MKKKCRENGGLRKCIGFQMLNVSKQTQLSVPHNLPRSFLHNIFFAQNQHNVFHSYKTTTKVLVLYLMTGKKNKEQQIL